MEIITVEALDSNMHVLRFDKMGVAFKYYGQRIPIDALDEVKKQLAQFGVKILHIKRLAPPADEGVTKELGLDKISPYKSQSPETELDYIQLMRKGLTTRSSSSDTNVVNMEDILSAEKVHTHAKETTEELLSDIRAGRPVNEKSAKNVVNELLVSFFKSPDAFVNMTNLKDMNNYTYTHSVNVAVVSIAIGRRMGLNIKELEILGLAGLLHDVGKMRIPKEILDKPGQLTEEEFRIMKMHPRYSYEIAKTIPGIQQEVLDGCKQHHEKSDGTGYPDGLIESQISRYAKIISIADVYDAITTERLYKKGMTAHDALKMLFNWSGRHFNDVLTKFFINLIGVYPLGTAVSLDSGEHAIVIQPNKQNSVRPKIIIYTDKNRERVEPYLYDLTECNLVTRKPYKAINAIIDQRELKIKPEDIIAKYTTISTKTSAMKRNI